MENLYRHIIYSKNIFSVNIGAGLPVGVREVKLIERARMKRQWERALPPAADAKSLTKRRNIIDAMEREEWAFREQVI